MKKGSLIVISGPSGAGKTTICHELQKKLPNAVFSVSATTRAQREGEIEARDYYFLSRKEFKGKIAKGELLEWAKVYNKYYGTPQKPVRQNLQGGFNVLLDIDMQGALQVKQKYPRALLFFILPQNLAELKKRLQRRGKDNIQAIRQRMRQLERELQYLPRYDYLIINEDLNQAVKKILEIIGKHS